MTEYESALLTAENHGEAHEFLQRGLLAVAVASLGRVISLHHWELGPMDRNKIILMVLSDWQETFNQ